MGTVGTRPRAQLPSPGLSVTPTRLLRVAGFHLGAPFLLDSPGTCSFLGRLGLWARARLSSGKAVCAVEKALAWPVGWRWKHILVLAHWRSSSKYAFSPSGSVSPLEQPGTGPGIAKPLSAVGFFSVLQTLSLSWLPSHWSLLGSGSAGKQPPTCYTDASGQKPSHAGWSPG